MAINNFFWQRPTVIPIPDCCDPTAPTSPPAPNLTMGTMPALAINNYIRVGEYVIAEQKNSAGVTTEVSGFVDNISADGQTTVIADAETGVTTSVSTRFVSFYGPVQSVNQYAGHNIGFNNNFFGPVYAVNQYGQGSGYRAKFIASTRALIGTVHVQSK